MVWYQRRANKYGNKKTAFGGRHYDSQLEATVAQEIDLLKRVGEVVEVVPQKTFPLYGRNGGRICNHRVDFLLTFKDGHLEAWEAKGFATEIWRLKRTLFEDNYPEILYQVITARGWWKPTNRMA